MTEVYTILLQTRETVIGFYKRYETVFRFLMKLIVGWFLCRFIFGIGGYREELKPLFEGGLSFFFLCLCAAMFAVLPPTLANGLIALLVVLQISAFWLVAIAAGLALVLVLCFYSRLAPEKSMLILAVIIGFHFKQPYAVVLFAGLYMGVSSIIPVTIGTFIWNFIPVFQNLMKTATVSETVDIMELPSTFLSVIDPLYAALTSDFGWIYYSFVFAMGIMGVYFISRLTINFVKEIAIAVGGFILIFGMAVGLNVVSIPIGLGSVIISVFFAIIIIEVVSFLDIALDYNEVKRVQFEDNDYYYFVKVVPKIGPGNPIRSAAESSDEDDDEADDKPDLSSYLDTFKKRAEAETREDKVIPEARRKRVVARAVRRRPEELADDDTPMAKPADDRKMTTGEYMRYLAAKEAKKKDEE